MHAYMHEKEEREGKILPQGDSFNGGRIGPSVANNLNNVEFQGTHL